MGEWVIQLLNFIALISFRKEDSLKKNNKYKIKCLICIHLKKKIIVHVHNAPIYYKYIIETEFIIYHTIKVNPSSIHMQLLIITLTQSIQSLYTENNASCEKTSIHRASSICFYLNQQCMRLKVSIQIIVCGILGHFLKDTIKLLSVALTPL